MSKKFVTQKERDFINRVNKEYIQSVIGQEVIYYSIIPELTQTNTLYGEAIKKTWASPVRINALVHWDNSTTQFTNLSADSRYDIEVYFHTLELSERSVAPKEGDFLEFGQVFFEITSVTKPQIVFGQINNKIMTKCMCTPAREGQFQAGSDHSQGVDRSHPTSDN